MANLTVPDLNFNYVADKTKYFKAFCVNPADDHCNLGLCPNTDVTGIGQQVSSESQLHLNFRFNYSDKWEHSIYHYHHLRYDPGSISRRDSS